MVTSLSIITSFNLDDYHYGTIIIVRLRFAVLEKTLRWKKDRVKALVLDYSRWVKQRYGTFILGVKYGKVYNG